MAKKTVRSVAPLSLFFAGLFLFHLFAEKKDRTGLDHLYEMGQFSRIVSILKNSGFEILSTRDKLLYIECLARSAQRNEADRLLQKITTDHIPAYQAHATAGIVHITSGQFVEAEHQLEQAMLLNPEYRKARMAKAMLDLYLQKYQEAQRTYEELDMEDPAWTESYLSHLLGIEVYESVGNLEKIAELYSIQAENFKKRDVKQHQNFRKNSRLYRRESKKRAFQIETKSDRVAVPFIAIANSQNYAAVPLKIDGESYKVLLDTGNRTGWTIHSRELEKELKHRPGGTVLTRIGAEEGILHGHRVITKQIEFRDFSLQNLPGMYVPKPHPDYPEANMNPLIIKDRVVTLDFIRKELILRTEKRFLDDLMKASPQANKIVSLPWYGYEQAFVPVVVNSEHKALAMIETGAEDITINLDFARRHAMLLEPAVKYLPTGKEFPYHKTPFQMSVDHFTMQRPAADVWFLENLADPITGLMPDILLGPEVFKERFALTFDPHQKRIIISELSF